MLYVHINQCTCVQAPPKQGHRASRPEKLLCPCQGVQLQGGKTKIPEECAGKALEGAGLWMGLHKPPSGSKHIKFLQKKFKIKNIKKKRDLH